MIDGNSQREFHGGEGMAFGAVALSPAVVLSGRGEWSFSLGPALGYGRITERAVVPTFGPSVTFAGDGRTFLGGRVGVRRHRAD